MSFVRDVAAGVPVFEGQRISFAYSAGVRISEKSLQFLVSAVLVAFSFHAAR